MGDFEIKDINGVKWILDNFESVDEKILKYQSNWEFQKIESQSILWIK